VGCRALGKYAQGGGIMAFSGSFTMVATSVRSCQASATAEASGGGMILWENTRNAIRDSVIRGCRAVVAAASATASAIGGGIYLQADIVAMGRVRIDSSVFTGCEVRARVSEGSGVKAGGSEMMPVACVHATGLRHWPRHWKRGVAKCVWRSHRHPQLHQ
jgi:hypothetical protein